LGIAAISLPFVIHWLTKPKPRRFALSTIRFVEQVVHQRRARYRLRDFLVLLLRAAAVALLAWVFARPLIGAKPLISVGDSGDAIRIVILDQSQSMAAVSNGIAAFDRAKPVAAKYLTYQAGSQGNLILAAAQPRAVFESLSSNFGAMRDELGNAHPQPQRLNLQPAIALAGDILSKIPSTDARRRELIIISDFQRSNWSSADFSALPKETLIQLESVAANPAPGNIGVLRVAAQGRLEQGREVRIEVDVGNYSTTPQTVQAELSVGSQTYRLSGLCPPMVKATLGTDIPLPAAGWQSGSVRLLSSSDALPADNARPFVLDVRPMPTYGLITREPGKPQPTSSHFLERALAPIKPRDGVAVERVVRIDPDSLDRDALAGVALIVLDHPGKLSQAQIDLLAALLRRGRGMLYVAAEPIDATNLKLLMDAAGADLKMPVEFVPPQAGQARRDLFLMEWRGKEAPFVEFGEDVAAVISPLRFSGGLSSRRLEGGLVDDVLATYSDRSAALVVTSCGAGALAVLNADLNQSNLPSSGAFVPLIGELVGRLLSQRRSDDAAPCGEPVAAYLPAEAGATAGLSIVSDDANRKELGALTDESNFVLWRWDAAGPPSVYSVKRDAATVFALATAVPAVESDLESIDANLLTTRLAGGRTVSFQSATNESQTKDSAWSWFLVACAMCMIGEFFVLKLFRT
jgi:hypothetical protein